MHLEDRDGDQPDHEHVERAQAAMDQHLVDHDLEEQRRDQAEQLEEERCDQHLDQLMAIFVDRAEEPADVEAPAEVDEAGAAGHQHQLPVPYGLEIGARHQRRTRRVG